jgi:hypothetical protein
MGISYSAWESQSRALLVQPAASSRSGNPTTATSHKPCSQQDQHPNIRAFLHEALNNRNNVCDTCRAAATYCIRTQQRPSLCNRIRAGQRRLRHLPSSRAIRWQQANRTCRRTQDCQDEDGACQTRSEGIHAATTNYRVRLIAITVRHRAPNPLQTNPSEHRHLLPRILFPHEYICCPGTVFEWLTGGYA